MAMITVHRKSSVRVSTFWTFDDQAVHHSISSSLCFVLLLSISGAFKTIECWPTGARLASNRLLDIVHASSPQDYGTSNAASPHSHSIVT